MKVTLRTPTFHFLAACAAANVNMLLDEGMTAFLAACAAANCIARRQPLMLHFLAACAAANKLY